MLVDKADQSLEEGDHLVEAQDRGQGAGDWGCTDPLRLTIDLPKVFHDLLRGGSSVEVVFPSPDVGMIGLFGGDLGLESVQLPPLRVAVDSDVVSSGVSPTEASSSGGITVKTSLHLEQRTLTPPGFNLSSASLNLVSHDEHCITISVSPSVPGQAFSTV